MIGKQIHLQNQLRQLIFLMASTAFQGSFQEFFDSICKEPISVDGLFYDFQLEHSKVEQNHIRIKSNRISKFS